MEDKVMEEAVMEESVMATNLTDPFLVLPNLPYWVGSYITQHPQILYRLFFLHFSVLIER